MEDPNAEETDTNPNVDFLEGKRCPKCGSYGPFEIEVSMSVLLYDNGTDISGGNVEYGDDSPTTCPSCQHEGKLSDFDE